MPVEYHDSAESILSGRTKTSWQRLLYLPARSPTIRPAFFIFAVGPGRKITTSFRRSNPEWWPAVTRRYVSAGECVSRSRSCACDIYGGACACLKKYTTGREREKRRGAGRPALRRAPSECVNIQAARRERAREKREREREKESETNLRSIYTATLNL